MSHLLSAITLSGMFQIGEPSRLFGPVQVVTTVTIIADREGERVVSRYNAQGNETETLRYVSPDTLAEKSVHTYNSSGKRTETVMSKPDGALLTKTLPLQFSRRAE